MGCSDGSGGVSASFPGIEVHYSTHGGFCGGGGSGSGLFVTTGMASYLKEEEEIGRGAKFCYCCY